MKVSQTNEKRYIIFFLVVDVITIIAAIAIGVFLFRRYSIQEHIKTAQGLTEYAAELIDADRTLEFIEKGSDAPGYDEIRAKLQRLMEVYPDIKYLYVTRIQEDGCYVVFDMDSGDEPGLEPGMIVDYKDAFLPYIDDLLVSDLENRFYPVMHHLRSLL
ncbi:MAG: hypothetical protein K5770_13625 [Lachnospiraceae bacterium]|nr:hypothetical protein [Lachnospiraceae bacterium]